MTKRHPLAVIGLSVITIGIYSIYWLVKTKTEMVKKGADIPTSWLLIVPFVNIYWLWKFSMGVGHVTKNKTDPILAFILLMVLDVIGLAVIQYELNNKSR